MRMHGKVAVVTGAARGIGRAIVERYAREGAVCAVADINEQAAADTAEALLFFTLQAAARHMVERGRGGKIINLASEAGQRADAHVIAYSATKAAVISITKTAALALIPHGINVNAISPGVVDTPMWEEVDRLFGKWTGKAVGQTRHEVELQVPFGRFGKPEDLAGAAVFLATEDSGYMIGQTVNVDGGRVMK